MIRQTLSLLSTILLIGCATKQVARDLWISRPTLAYRTKADGNTNYFWKASNRIPWQNHGLISWSMYVYTTRTNTASYALYILPETNDYRYVATTNSNWKYDPIRDGSMIIGDEQSQIYTNGEFKPLYPDNRIDGIWCMVPGEPLGEYSIIAFVDRVPVHVFRFEIFDTNGVQQARGENGEPAPASRRQP